MSSGSVAVLGTVRDRVRRFISVPSSDAEALKICFLCATVESDALLELSHSRVVRSEALTHCDVLAITSDEFNVLLGDNALSQARKYNLASVLLEEGLDLDRKQHHEAIETALKLTLQENTQRDLWDTSPRVRARVDLAVMRKLHHVDCIQQALGEVLRSDLPRVDDLRAETEIRGIDLMNVAALISTLCTHIASALQDKLPRQH